ncbi:ArsR/SmtB family transcription factor [Streptomyces sp. GS7]|uniref:ArsR/SmtB family transcription factor n=1 Tax=Streptomyces sp. GS7 TaxID=2692234 RepID=UPI0013195B12|nr:metalloregulator ArsR/SmtB family transcription factor [Streptomyces sp. GS7]QHC22073.1 metalloregulator ArsR/SmtB family transcription factor [Streptomyces sp. GS7]
MSKERRLVMVASLLADSSRVRILYKLLDGKAYSASELTDVAGTAASTASSHLSKLVAGGLLDVKPQGRHRYYRLAQPEIAQFLNWASTLNEDPPAA